MPLEARCPLHPRWHARALGVDLKDETNAPVTSVVTTNRYDEELHLIATTVGDGAGQVLKRGNVVFDQAARPFLTIPPSGRKRKVICWRPTCSRGRSRNTSQ